MIVVLRRGGELEHLVAADIPSLERLSPRECADLIRELADDVRRATTRRDGEEPADGDLATEGDW